jgi:hypothetical protein
MESSTLLPFLQSSFPFVSDSYHFLYTLVFCNDHVVYSRHRITILNPCHMPSNYIHPDLQDLHLLNQLNNLTAMTQNVILRWVRTWYFPCHRKQLEQSMEQLVSSWKEERISISGPCMEMYADRFCNSYDVGNQLWDESQPDSSPYHYRSQNSLFFNPYRSIISHMNNYNLAINVLNFPINFSFV